VIDFGKTLKEWFSLSVKFFKKCFKNLLNVNKNERDNIMYNFDNRLDRIGKRSVNSQGNIIIDFGDRYKMTDWIITGPNGKSIQAEHREYIENTGIFFIFLDQDIKVEIEVNYLVIYYNCFLIGCRVQKNNMIFDMRFYLPIKEGIKPQNIEDVIQCAWKTIANGNLEELYDNGKLEKLYDKIMWILCKEQFGKIGIKDSDNVQNAAYKVLEQNLTMEKFLITTQKSSEQNILTFYAKKLEQHLYQELDLELAIKKVLQEIQRNEKDPIQQREIFMEKQSKPSER